MLASIVPPFTLEYLKSIIHYEPLTGVFTWLVYRGSKAKAGDVAGAISNGYIHIGIQGKVYKAHRLAFLYMTGKFPENQTDHVNHIRSDNRWENIRSATVGDNNKNKSIRKDNNSGVCGVNWDNRAGKWHSEIRSEGHKFNLGRFDELEDAIAAREAANIKYNFHGNHGK